MAEPIAGVALAGIPPNTEGGGPVAPVPTTPPAIASPAPAAADGATTAAATPSLTREQIPAELLTTLQGEWQAELRKDVPASAAEYGLPDLKDLVPEGFALDGLTETPLLAKFRDIAHQYGVPKATYDELVRGHFEFVRDMDVIDRPAETAKLGARAQERLEKVSLWTGANVPAPLQGLAKVLSETAAGVELLEHFMGRSAGPSLSVDPGQGGGGAGGPPDKAAAQAEYDKLMALPPRERGVSANFVRRQELAAIIHGTAVPEFAAKVLRG